MKSKIFLAFVATQRFILIIISIIMFFTDRICSVFIFKRSMPTLNEVAEFKFYKKDIVKRTKNRIIFLTALFAIYLIMILIEKNIELFKMMYHER